MRALPLPLLLLALPSLVRAQAPNGAQVYAARCAACHGQAIPTGPAWPARFTALHRAVEPVQPDQRAALLAFRQERRAQLLAAALTPPANPPQQSLAAGDRPPVPPRWVLLPWKWKNEHSGWQDALADADALARHDLPCGAYMIDSPWATGYGTLRFEPQRFGRAGERVAGERLIADLQARGLKVLLWLTPIVNDGSQSKPLWDGEAERALHVEGERRGLFVDEPLWRVILGRGLSGTRIKWWKGVGSHIELRRPEGCAWWGELMDRALVDLRVDGFKVDGGWPPLTREYYSQTAARVQARTGGRGVTLSRPLGGNLASAGACWTGDEEPDWSGMQVALSRMRAAAAAGYGTVGSDIGGFGGPPSEAVLVRWAQLGCVSGVMELGGGGVHEPWEISERCLELYRFYAHLRCELGPYLHDACHQAHQVGTPLLRFTEPEAFLVGAELFAAPCRFERGAREVRLPAGRWLDLFAPTRSLEGAQTIEVPDLARFPLFVREWALLPLETASAYTGLGAPEAADALTLAVFAPPGADGPAPRLQTFSWGDDPRPVPTVIGLTPLPGGGLRLDLTGRALAWPRLVLRVANRRLGAARAHHGAAVAPLRAARDRDDFWRGAPGAVWVDPTGVTWARLDVVDAAGARLERVELRAE